MKLEVNVIKAKHLIDEQKTNMYSLMSKYYENLTYKKFREDFENKEDVILLMDSENIYGFTTIEHIPMTIEGREIIGIFSGNTIVDQTYPIGLELQQGFCKYISRLIEIEKREVYWFLICKGYKTYRYMSIYFEEYYPSMKRNTPVYEQAIIDGYAILKYGQNYNSSTGIISNTGFNDYLKEGVAPINEKVKKNPVNIFFEMKNPKHSTGDELVCLARFSKENLKRAFFRVIR